MGAMVNAISKAALLDGSKRVMFEPGPPLYVDPQQFLAFINLTNAHQMIINGQGLKMIFTSPVSYILTSNCTDILVKNFEFDLQPYAYTALVVKALARTESSVTAELLPGHPTVESNPLFSR